MSTNKKEPIFEISIPRAGIKFKPTRYDQFVTWTKRERSRWDWLEEGVGPEFPQGTCDSIFNFLDELVSFAVRLDAQQDLGGESPQDTFNGRYGASAPQLLHSNSETGRAVMALRKGHGSELAALAYALLTGQMGPTWGNPLHVRALFLASNPSMINREAVRSANQADYARWRNEGDALLAEHREAIESHRAVITDQAEDADLVAIRSFWKIARRSGTLRKTLQTKAESAIRQIHQVREAYQEDMQLKASVQYWAEKRKAHAENRTAALRHLKLFALAAGAGSLILFLLAIIFMLEASGVDATRWMAINPQEGRTIALSAYLIVAGAVGTVLTVLFWTARVLLRNYLTERRLEGDAEERRIMTQTYLALISEDAASEEDRLIILNALFRPAPDLPNSDDSGGDIALPALVAKLMDQRPRASS